MEVKAKAKQIRIAPRKVRLVVDLVRGKDVKDAISILRLTPKASSTVVEKLLLSAVANAKHNNQLEAANLFIKEAFVDEGPTLKRFLPRAKGSASQILKRTSHITIVLAERNV